MKYFIIFQFLLSTTCQNYNYGGNKHKNNSQVTNQQCGFGKYCPEPMMSTGKSRDGVAFEVKMV